MVAADAVPACRMVLAAGGFAVERDWLPAAIAFRHAGGMAVDLHPVEPTADGGGDQIQLDGVQPHLGYEPDDQDRADMTKPARHFGIELPAPYAVTR